MKILQYSPTIKTNMADFRSGVDVADLANAVYGAIERYSDETLDWESGESLEN